MLVTKQTVCGSDAFHVSYKADGLRLRRFSYSDFLCWLFPGEEGGGEVELDICIYVCGFCQQPYARQHGVVSHIHFKHWTPDIKPQENFTRIPLKGIIKERFAKRGERKKRFGCLCCGGHSMSRPDITGHICVDAEGKVTCLRRCPKGKTLIKNDRRLLFNTDRRCLLCPTCGAMFSERLSLDSHLMKEHGQVTERHKKHHCARCNKMFARKSGLDIHNARVHTQGDKASAFICDFCGEKFSSMNSLYCHRKYTHVAGRSYQCQYCPKNFFKRHLWITHTKRHLGEKPYMCKICKKDFTCNSNLMTHMRIHTGERPYKCGSCEADFIQRSSLVVHTTRKHPPGGTADAKVTDRGVEPTGSEKGGMQQTSVSDSSVHDVHSQYGVVPHSSVGEGAMVQHVNIHSDTPVSQSVLDAESDFKMYHL
ncbi:zinc finger protein 251-like [Littorina saxatilis]|uniref:zinc finger protein 251-like n=1 Tax=Littorina saxatilis TaxID=31220 RepID=UPI0038B47287